MCCSNYFILDAAVDESVQVRIFNPNFKGSDTELLQLIDEVDLESHGYKKSVIRELVSDSSNNKPVIKKTFYYYKDVPCTRLENEEIHLDKLLKGLLGRDIERRVKTEVRDKKLDKMRKCRAGVEFHFNKDHKNCAKHGGKRQKRGCWAWRCGICSRMAAEE